MAWTTDGKTGECVRQRTDWFFISLCARLQWPIWAVLIGIGFYTTLSRAVYTLFYSFVGEWPLVLLGTGPDRAHIVRLRPNFERRSSRAWIFSAFMLLVYFCYTITMVLEYKTPGGGDCLSIATQILTYM